MEHAKINGKAVGKPRTTENDIPHIFYKHYPKYTKGEINKKSFSGFILYHIQFYTNIRNRREVRNT